MGDAVAGLLLTGGASRRLGRDKAQLVLGDETFAERAGRVLASVATPALEVGPGRSGLPAVVEDPPGSGPLAAVAAGWRALKRRGHAAAVLVLAVDMPQVGEDLLRRLAEHPSPKSVVPRIGGRSQPLCARYVPADLDRVEELLAGGERSMRSWLAGIEAVEPALAEGDEAAFADVDTEADLARVLRWDNRAR